MLANCLSTDIVAELENIQTEAEGATSRFRGDKPGREDDQCDED